MPTAVIARWGRYLFFLTTREELARLSWRTWLGPALVATWLAGMGRYWDHPSAGLLQMFGVGSVVYVFVLGALLWAMIVPLRPRRWSYLQTVTFVGLTAPPAFLYALPVERWMTLDRATATNAWFLAVVAAWRVALLLFVLRRHAGLTWPRTIVGGLLPLSAIVTSLFVLNLEKAVFAVMGGFRQPTANDGAYAILFLLTFLSLYAAVPLLVAYLFLARRGPANTGASTQESPSMRATHSVVLRLDPSAMENPDLRVRWDLEKVLRASYPDLSFVDDGYGFARHSDAMLLSYATSEPVRLVDALVDVLTTTTISGNRLATAAMVAVAVRSETAESGQEFAEHRLVYPAHEGGKPLPD